jgi:SanA protein
LISRRSVRRVVRRWVYIIGGLFLGLMVLINHWVINNTEAYVYTSWALLPDNDAGLVLGTSPYLKGGKANPQFRGRIEAAIMLYQLGKVKRLIVSGANPDASYNEPRQMWRELVQAGIPSSAITMDFAGDRTYDSVARTLEVFGMQRVTVITQAYHAYRAVFIGKKLRMKICAYAAPGGDISLFSRTYIREVLARLRAVLDIYILQPVAPDTSSPEQLQEPPEPMMPAPPLSAPSS